MLTKTMLSLILIFNITLATSFSQTGNLPPNNESGKCYAKCLIMDKNSTTYQQLAVFTGDEAFEEVDLEVFEITIKPASSKWEKKRADKNCNSPDPNDCLVWCQVEVPAEIETYKVLLDTSQSKNFVWKDIQQERLSKKGGYTEWREILCDEDTTRKVCTDIQDQLSMLNYYSGKMTGAFDTKTKSALSIFQKDNGLPIGQLDMETLDALGIIF